MVRSARRPPSVRAKRGASPRPCASAHDWMYLPHVVSARGCGRGGGLPSWRAGLARPAHARSRRVARLLSGALECKGGPAVSRGSPLLSSSALFSHAGARPHQDGEAVLPPPHREVLQQAHAGL